MPRRKTSNQIRAANMKFGQNKKRNEENRKNEPVGMSVLSSADYNSIHIVHCPTYRLLLIRCRRQFRRAKKGKRKKLSKGANAVRIISEDSNLPFVSRSLNFCLTKPVA